MSEGNSVINFGDLSKPATVLIEQVSKAIGVLYEPRRIVKQAEAYAKAEEINVLSSIKMSELQKRGIDRLILQEGRKQDNIESITKQAVNFLDESSNVEKLDEDWIVHFFKSCEGVSDKEMQLLWSKILHGEAVRSGTYSKRTLDFVSSMDKIDAVLFTNLCQFICFFSEMKKNIPIIFNTKNKFYVDRDITVINLKHLESIGLISIDFINGYTVGFTDEALDIKYFGEEIKIPLLSEKSTGEISIGKVFLSNIGQELSTIANTESIDGFYEYVRDIWLGNKVAFNNDY